MFLSIEPFNLSTILKNYFIKKEKSMSENLFEFTDENFTEKVIHSEMPVLVDFWAEWCGPCRMLTPVIEEIANEYNDKILCGKVNVDISPTIASNYGIRSIPSLLFFNNGEVTQQLVGAVAKNKITTVLDKLID